MKTNILSLVLFVLLTYFAPTLGVEAVVPPPDGCNGNFTTAEGCDALNLLTTGAGNTGLGWRSLFSDGTGNFNTGVGAGALVLNNGDSNTAVGAAALLLNTTGAQNTAVGTDALVFNTADDNTAVGFEALLSNTTGPDNTAIGFGALATNTIGNDNTALGFEALLSNSIGVSNTAIGSNALASNTTGNSNTAIGLNALASNTTGLENIAVGGGALSSNANGANNTAIGIFALQENTSGQENTAVGDSALQINTSGSNNIALGQSAGANLTTGNLNIDIGNNGSIGDAQTIRIGAQGVQTSAFVAGIFGATASSGTPVYVNSDGQLGTTTSSARFKRDIRKMEGASEVLFALQPVAFRYNKEIDPAGTPQFGLVAEEVAKVNPALVLPDKEGKPYTVRYEAVNAMLLNEFLKEHRKVDKLESIVAKQEVTAAKQEARVAEQQQQIEALTAGLQKVSAQLTAASPSRGGLEASKPAPQVVNNR